MSVSAKALGIDRLGIEERIALVGEIWDSIAVDTPTLPITDAQRLEIDRRIAEHEANPDDVVAWEKVSGRGHLATVVSDPLSEIQSDSPATILSSSQMNALAVCTFLSLNLGISRPPLDAAILDDPLQSLALTYLV